MDGQQSASGQRPGSYVERDHDGGWELVGLEEWEELSSLPPITVLPLSQAVDPGKEGKGGPSAAQRQPSHGPSSTNDVIRSSDIVVLAPDQNDDPPPEVTLRFALLAHASGRQQLDGSIYLSGDDGGEVRQAVAELLVEYGYRLSDVGEPRRGSWWQLIRAQFSADENPLHDPDDDFLTDSPPVQRSRVQRMDEETRARQERLALDVIEAIKEHDEAVVVLSSILVLKYRGTLTVSQLHPWQSAEISENPKYLTSPRAMYEYMRDASRSRNGAAVSHAPVSRQKDAGPEIPA